MKTIIYSPKGQSISDFDLSETLDNILQFTDEFETSSILLLNEIRCRVAEKTLAHDSIKIIFEGKQIYITENGRWLNRHFEDVYSKQLTRILGF